MTAYETQRLHRSDAVRAAQATILAQHFDLHLRGSSPGLASAIEAASLDLNSPAVALLISAILSVADQQDPAGAVACFDRLRQAAANVPHRDALVGRSLVTSLEAVLGDAFDQTTREAWVDAYVRLVETVMSGRCNRIDLVA